MLTDLLEKKLEKHHADDLIRQRFAISDFSHNHIIVNGHAYINFSSNDYLSMTSHPDVKKAFIQAVETFGVGSGASPMVSGFYAPHAALEEKFARILKRDKAIFFNSGYHANLGVITALANKHTHVISDKLCHASLIDGAILSRAKLQRYEHNDLTHCDTLLNKTNGHALIVSEGVFSMEGDIAQAKGLSTLAKKYHATLILDDAHGFGVLGKKGKGTSEAFGLTQKELPCLIIPFGKALGTMGAIVAGEKKLIETVLQFSRSYCYSTALPPAICAATSQSLDIILKETWRRERLHTLISFFISEAEARALPLVTTAHTPIQSILIGENKKALAMQEALRKKGFFVTAMRPPTVPKGTARIRISLTISHEEKDIVRLLDELVKCL